MGVKASIIIPTYNRASYLGKTLASVKAQTIAEWECIVVDDGSEDGTDELMQNITAEDPRFIYIERPPNTIKGGNTCRNIGLEYSKGKYIQFLDSDDLISKNKLEDQLNALNCNEAGAIATCKWGFFHSDEEQLGAAPYKPTYINAQDPLDLINVYSKHITYLPLHVFLTSKETINKAGPWNEILMKNQDTDYLIRVLLQCTRVIFVPTAEAYYRIGAGDNVSILSSVEKVNSAILCWKLVDEQINSKYKIASHAYVRIGKTELYKKIKNKYPSILIDNNNFFRDRYSKFDYFIIKVLSRLEIMYFRRVAPQIVRTDIISKFKEFASYSFKLIQRLGLEIDNNIYKFRSTKKKRTKIQ